MEGDQALLLITQLQRWQGEQCLCFAYQHQQNAISCL